MHITVERVSYLHEEEINNLMNEIKHSLRPEEPSEALIIRRAVTLVRNGAIESYSYNSTDETVFATVEGVDSKDVQLSFTHMNAKCTCNHNGWCSHRVAVIFHLFLQSHSLTDWLEEWRRTEVKQMTLKISERTPEAWNLVLSQLTRPLRIIETHENPAVFIHEFSLIEQKVIPLSPFEWEWKPLFDVYYRLQALDAAWPYVHAHLGEDISSFSYGKWYVKNWLADQLGKLQDSIVAVASKPRLFQTDPFHDQLAFMSRVFVLNNMGLFNERFKVYRLFWQHLFTNNSLRNAERAALQDEKLPDSIILIAFFHVLQGQHRELQEIVDRITIDNFSNWLPLADLADYDEEIESLTIIMRALLPFVGDYLSQTVQLSRRPSFARKIDGLLEAADFPEIERESMFMHYGEAGVDVYADFLVERERFQEWAALMHRYQISYDAVEAGGLKIALAKDPAAVLPLLHTFAMSFIEEKNRHSYRRAVKLLKKMKMGSKKSGKIDFWNQYVDALREKNRRLRALMEEIEKGNLKL